jgi:putative peptidoglycan lipid II flippase
VAAAFLLDPGARRDWLHPHFTQQALFGVCFGVLLGGLAQLAVQLPSLWRLGFRFRWRLSIRDERLRQVWSLMWPSMIAGAAVQVNVLINGMFASEIDGARSWLGCAFRLMQFPIGVFGVSLATVTLPGIARRAARDDVGAFGRTVSQSLRLALFFTVPAAVGLAVLARSIITLIYQHGHFTAQATLQTAHALQAYAVGLAAYAALKVLVPCFYALGVPKLPLRVSLIGIGLNLVLNLLNARVFGFGHVGLALITSCVAMINFGQLLFALSRRVPLGSLGRWVGFVLRLLAAAAVSGAAAWVGDTIVHTALRGMAANLALPAVIAVAAGGFFVAARLLAISEATDAWALIMRRLRPKRAPAG